LVADSVLKGDSMFRIAKNAAAALALTGLALSQPALAVRSAESLPAAGAKVTSVNRAGSPVTSSEDFRAIPVFGWVLGALIVIGVIIIIATDNNDSPG
jgi:hypothetical protein